MLLGGDLIQRVRGGRVGESGITCCKLAFQDENETETRLGCFYATTVHVTWALALPLLGEDDTDIPQQTIRKGGPRDCFSPRVPTAYLPLGS